MQGLVNHTNALLPSSPSSPSLSLPRRRSIMGIHVVVVSMVLLAVSISLGPMMCAPPSPVDCSSNGVCKVWNTYGTWPDRSQCIVAKVVYPKTQQELVAAVAEGVAKHQKMKVVSTGSYSIPKLVCPGGEHGLAISTRDYNTNLTFDASSLTVVADSGVTLRQLVNAAATHNMALPYTPYWEGVSLGGMISTGAHGSSLFGNGGAVHEYVLSMTLVVPTTAQEGYAKLIQISHSNIDLNAAKVSLGVLGAISQVTLQLQPMFKRSLTNLVKQDIDLEKDFLPFARAHEFADFTWYLSQKKVVYRMDDRVPINASGNGVNDFLGFQPNLPSFLDSTRNNEDLQEANKNTLDKCIGSEIRTQVMLGIGAGYKNSESLGFMNYPVVGYQHLMQASGACLYADLNLGGVCAWDPRVKGLFFHQTSVAIPISKAPSFISDVARLRDLNKDSLCGLDLYNGFMLRFVKASTAYLGEEEDALNFDMTYYRSHDAHTPRLNEDVVEEIEQMALVKYGGRPHWGKNRPIAFQGVKDKYKDMGRFIATKQIFDPEALFSSEWSDWLLGISTTPLGDEDYCALEGLCICSEDRHCAPEKGYLCRSGLVYTQAKVCRNER